MFVAVRDREIKVFHNFDEARWELGVSNPVKYWTGDGWLMFYASDFECPSVFVEKLTERFCGLCWSEGCTRFDIMGHTFQRTGPDEFEHESGVMNLERMIEFLSDLPYVECSACKRRCHKKISWCRLEPRHSDH